MELLVSFLERKELVLGQYWHFRSVSHGLEAVSAFFAYQTIRIDPRRTND